MNENENGGTRRPGPSEEELRAAVPRDAGGREARVGIFVVIGIIAVVGALFLLTDPATLRGRYMVVTQVEDAGGIRRGDPVLMRGVNIGRINGFEMSPAGTVDITMEIEGNWDIPEDSFTRLAGAGLFGGRTMEVVRGVSSNSVEPGDTIPGAEEAGGIFESAEALGTRAEEVLTSIQSVLQEPTVGALRGSASELQGLIAQLRQIATIQRDQLATLTTSLNRSAAGLEEAAAAGPDVARLVQRTDSAVLVLTRTGATLDRAVGSLESVLARLDSGQGTLGRLANDDSLYVNLNQAAAQIGLLAQDVRENPRRYFNLELF